MVNETHEQPNNPLHGVTLEKMLICFVDHYGWNQLHSKIDVNCFYNNPSIKSCLKFFRQTSWARTKLEEIYLDMLWEQKRNNKQ